MNLITNVRDAHGALMSKYVPEEAVGVVAVGDDGHLVVMAHTDLEYIVNGAATEQILNVLNKSLGADEVAHIYVIGYTRQVLPTASILALASRLEQSIATTSAWAYEVYRVRSLTDHQVLDLHTRKTGRRYRLHQHWRAIVSHTTEGTLDACTLDHAELIQDMNVDVHLRDAILADMLGIDPGPLLDQSGVVPRSFGRLYQPGASAPDLEDLAHCHQALAHLLTEAPHTAHAPLLALQAWVAWHRNDNTAAITLATAAIEAKPGYTLAHLVRYMVTGHMLPGWVPATKEMHATA